MKKRWQLLVALMAALHLNITESQSTESRPLPRKFLITRMSDIKNRTMDIAYVHQVTLSNSTEWSLTHDEFKNYPRLHTLIIANQPIARHWYTQNLFICTNLSHLQLTDSNLKILPTSSFIYTPNLLTLNLAGNHFEQIQNDALKPLAKLKQLDLSRNSINSAKLEHLNLSTLKNLTTLILADNNVDKLSSISSKSLKSLDISRNIITRIAAEHLQHLPHLQELIIRENRLKKIDLMVFSITEALHHLDLSQNQLTILPNYKNFLIKQEIKYFSCIKCNIMEIHSTMFAKIRTITTMDLSYNELKSFSKEIFQVLHVLNTLKLAYNKISHIPNDMFDAATALTDLSLTGNPLKTISVTPFLALPHLRTLSVDDCGLQHIWNQADGVLKTLKYLSARKNRIEVVSYEEMTVMANLSGLALFDNPLRCGDDFENLVDWMQWKNVFPMEINVFQQPAFPICNADNAKSSEQQNTSECPPQSSELVIIAHTVVVMVEILTAMYVIWSCGKDQIRSMTNSMMACFRKKATGDYKLVIADQA